MVLIGVLSYGSMTPANGTTSELQLPGVAEMSTLFLSRNRLRALPTPSAEG